MFEPIHWDLRAIGFIVGGALFWLMYFDQKDRLNPEPRRLLVVAYLLGGVAASAGLAGYWIVEWFGGPDGPGAQKADILFYCLGIVGPIEEGAKFLVSWLFVFRWAHFDEPIDGLIYASAVAVGFASIENLLYAQFLEWPQQLARSLAAPLTQSLFSSIWGFGAGYAYFRHIRGWIRKAILFSTLVASVAFHGVYDYMLLAAEATYVASGIALVLWLLMIAIARRLANHEGANSTKNHEKK